MGERFSATGKELTDLAGDLDGMQEYLKAQIDRLNGIVDRLESGWRGSAARAYKDLQRSVNEDAVTIRKTLILIEEAVRMSRDGFSAQEIETMERFQRIQSTQAGEREILGMADEAPAQPVSPISKLT